jgi:biofilm protein TabA
MIFGRWEDLEAYRRQLPHDLYECLLKLCAFDFDGKPDGKYEIEGAGTMSVESPMTEPASARKLEGHRRFIDVVLLLRGEEWIGCRPLSDAGKLTEAYADRDLYFFEGAQEETRVHMLPGRFLICFPEDLHRPLCEGKEGPAKIRKAVLKYPVW